MRVISSPYSLSTYLNGGIDGGGLGSDHAVEECVHLASAGGGYDTGIYVSYVIFAFTQ